jgi:hypothetical protein
MDEAMTSFCVFKRTALRAFLAFLLIALPLPARIDVDFDPGAEVSKYKSFAFIGGVRNLTMLQMDPELLDNNLHRDITRELTKKGLREVQSNQNPDVVVRYWVNTSQQVNVAAMGDWSPYRPYIDSYWTPMYDAVSASSGKDSTTLVLDLIDAHSKKLAWRLYLTRKLTNADKDWKKADEEIIKAFESYPPSEKERETRRKERAEHPPSS